MASERSGVTSVVQNESLLAHYFHCVMHCLNLSASTAIKVSAKQNVENVARKVVKIFKANAKKTALLQRCIKEDASSQGKAKRYLVGFCETRFEERHVSIPALVAEAGSRRGAKFTHFYNNTYNNGGKSCNLDHLTKKPPKYQPQDNFSINLIFW